MAATAPEVERAIYFCCLEALQNTYKHAHTATAAHVRIAARGRELTFEVSDNGPGFDVGAVAPGAGLHNMHDRVASLGGSLTIDAGRSGRGSPARYRSANRAPRTGGIMPPAGRGPCRSATSRSVPRGA